MSDAVQVALIVALVVVILLLLFRKSLRRFTFTAGDVHASMEAHGQSSTSAPTIAPAGVSIKGISQTGENHTVKAAGPGISIQEVEQQGKGQKLDVRSK